MRHYRFAVATLLMASGGAAFGQAIGPDLVNASMNDIVRNGTNAAGTIVGYGSGSVTCNRGDMVMNAAPDGNTRPLVGMNMYRLKSYGAYQRFEQVGQGWAKWVGVPVNGQNSACGASCVGGGTPFGTLGINCADVYSSGFNAPAGMGPRSRINATTGVLSGGRGTNTGETTVSTRVQVATSDVTAQPAGTRFFFETVDLLPEDATYVRPGQTVAINAMNNATSNEISINGGTSTPGFMGGPSFVPAISRWRDIDPAVVMVTADHDDTPNPNRLFPGTMIRSRFHVAARTTDLGNGRWRYEYAVFNLNSDRSCGSFTLPMPAGVEMTDVTFRHPLYHSGEPISNAPWTAARGARTVTFSTQTFGANANANAVRWGTTYNFGFTAPVAPRPGSGTLGLFKPGALPSIVATGIPAPGMPACDADLSANGSVDLDDLLLHLGFLAQGDARADMDNGLGAGVSDGGVTIEDLLFYLDHYAGGC